LDKICQDYPELMCIVERHVLDHFQVEIDSLPCWEINLEASAYESELARDYMKFGVEDPFYTRSSLKTSISQPTQKREEDKHDLVSCRCTRRE
jgi:hypothetical protein